MRDMSNEKIRPKDGCTVEALKDIGFTQDNCRKGERKICPYYYIVFYVHMQTSSESSVDPLGLYRIQSLHGKKVFNNLPCQWKCPVIHPTMPCALFNPSSIRGARLIRPVLLLLALAPCTSQRWPWGQPCHQTSPA